MTNVVSLSLQTIGCCAEFPCLVLGCFDRFYTREYHGTSPYEGRQTPKFLHSARLPRCPVLYLVVEALPADTFARMPGKTGRTAGETRGTTRRPTRPTRPTNRESETTATSVNWSYYCIDVCSQCFVLGVTVFSSHYSIDTLTLLLSVYSYEYENGRCII